MMAIDAVDLPRGPSFDRLGVLLGPAGGIPAVLAGPNMKIYVVAFLYRPPCDRPGGPSGTLLRPSCDYGRLLAQSDLVPCVLDRDGRRPYHM
eukprot:2833865-Pyramimonas_sp.AAC.1